MPVGKRSPLTAVSLTADNLLDQNNDWIDVHLPNVKGEPRPGLARLVRLGARGVTVPVVGSDALFGAPVLEEN